MWVLVGRKPLGLLVVLIASVASLPAVPKPEQELEIERGLSVARAAVTTVGKCLETSTVMYVETVVVVKDDTSLIRGTIEISIGKPIIIDCARIVAKTEHDRKALKGQKLSGTNKIEISVAEDQPSQSSALEYTVFVYATLTSGEKP